MDAPESKKPETIRERIDRKIKEEQAAGSARPEMNRDLPEMAGYKGQVKDPIMDVDSDRRYIEHEFERTFRELTPLVAMNWDELFLLCDLRGRPIAEAKRTDYHFLRYQILDWLKEWPREENYALLHPEESVREGTASHEFGHPAPGPWTQQAIDDITKILGARGHSYAADEDEFQNFIEQAQLGDQTLRQVFRGALGQKLAREKSTYARLDALFEVEPDDPEAYRAMVAQWLDSIRDICGYALLMFGWAKRVEVHGE